jgi:tetratricopeptide (TPR) repeat protein
MTSEDAVNSKAGFGLLAWRALLILAAGFLAWRIIVLGLASLGLEQLKEGDTAAAERVLSLLPRHPEALYRQAIALLPTNAIGAEAQLAEAYRRDPTQARPLLALAELALTRDEAERADALVTQAVKLEPAEAMIHRRAAIYWLKRGQMERGLQHLSLALVARPQAHQDLLDIFMRIAEDHTTRMALGPLAQDPPAWWPSFFERLAQRALDVETVRFVYGLRTRASRTPVTPEERQAYLQRLLKDGLIAEAYLTWVNGLTTAERGHMGLLHNGGFELPLGKAGFDWRSIPHRQVVARTATTFGVGGERALQMVFRNQKGPFHHLRQSLFLDPGTYRLSGNVRSESLASQGGLRWTLRCLQPREAVLGESERFLGSEKWRGFRVDFEVPEDCRLQEIRLESAGKRDFEQRISGEIWFDDLAIRRSTGLTAAARADELARGRDAMTGAEGEGEGEKAVNGSDGSGEDSRPGQEGQAEDHKDVQDGSEGPRL